MTETSGDRQLSALDGKTFKGKIPTQQHVPLDVKFVHIPKTGGDSVMLGSPNFLLRGQTLQGNHESSYPLTKTQINLEDDRLALVFLRNPISHVLSQFLECKYDSWGKKVTKRTGFPGYGSSDDVLDGFDEWVAHFALNPDLHITKKQGGKYAFKCYDPWNLQTRYLTMNTGGQMAHWCHTPECHYPSLEEAKSNLRDKKLLLGITEHLSASMCLLEHYATKGNLTKKCTTCDPDTHNLYMVDKKQHHNSHGVPHHSVEMITNQTTLQHLQTLTNIDQQLYDYALELFHDEINKVGKTTGVDLLCGAPELERKLGVVEPSQLGLKEGPTGTASTPGLTFSSDTTWRTMVPKQEVGPAMDGVNGIDMVQQMSGFIVIFGMLLLVTIVFHCFRSSSSSTSNPSNEYTKVNESEEVDPEL